MDAEICKNFLLVRTNFPDQLDNNGNYKIEDDTHFKEYCSNQNCVNELEKISAGCLYLFNEFFKDSSV
ncbi:Plasmodium variant antigen protein Cir/Yir/Bir, putative, partial [Plasmodium berghei]